MSEVESLPCLKINCPELFADPEFVAWLNVGASSRGATGSPEWKPGPVATWHRGGTPHEYSDTFVTYDGGEGSDSDMPEHCWERLCEVAREVGVTYAVLWLTNLGE
jgi:hypothetical protein